MDRREFLAATAVVLVALKTRAEKVTLGSPKIDYIQPFNQHPSERELWFVSFEDNSNAVFDPNQKKFIGWSFV